MPFIEECLPNLIALGATGGPEFRTAIETTPGGFEARSDLWLLERGRWNLAYDARDAATTALLLAFFCSVACGRWNGFRFHDPQPDGHRCVGEYLGTGDGVAREYQLRKLYTVGEVTYVRPITKPVAGTLRLTLDGVSSEDWTLDPTSGVVTTTEPVPVGVLVHGSWLFDVPVRFDTDWLDIRYLEPGLFAWHNATIVEIQDAVPPAPLPEPPVLSGVVIHKPASPGYDAHLEWTEPETYGLAILGYRLYRRSGNGTIVPTALQASQLEQTYVDPETSPAEEIEGVQVGGYTYAVTVLTRGGESAPSNLVWLTAPEEQMFLSIPASVATVYDAMIASSVLVGVTSNASGTVTYSTYRQADDTFYRTGGVKAVVDGIVEDSDPVYFDEDGVFRWEASYSGDTLNPPLESLPALVLLTVKWQPSMTIVPSEVSVGPGATYDFVAQATLHGETGDAEGTVTYADGGVVAVVDGAVTGTSDLIHLIGPITYAVHASYSGDARNWPTSV